MYNGLQIAGAHTALLQTSIDALNSALVLLDQNGKVVFLNIAAERLIRRCHELCVRRDRLCAGRHADTLQLERLTKRATGTSGRRRSGGAVTIKRTLGEQPLQVVAAPLPLDTRTKFTGDLAAVALLVIHDPSEKAYVPQEIIRTTFGLTPAEARLLLALSNGQSLREYSEEYHVTRNTARTHLKSLFAKTRTSKQSDLVRLLNGLTHSVALSEK